MGKFGQKDVLCGVRIAGLPAGALPGSAADFSEVGCAQAWRSSFPDTGHTTAP